MSDCDHYLVEDIERDHGIPVGVCARCHRHVWAVGDEDEQGIPGWELMDEQPKEYVEWRGALVEVVD